MVSQPRLRAFRGVPSGLSVACCKEPDVDIRKSARNDIQLLQHEVDPDHYHRHSTVRVMGPVGGSEAIDEDRDISNGHVQDRGVGGTAASAEMNNA